MKCQIPEISWHNRDPVFSVDIQSNFDLKDTKAICRLASGGSDAHVLIWYINQSENDVGIELDLAADLARHQRAVNAVRWSPNGELLASGDDEGVVFIWKQKADNEVINVVDETNEQDKEIWIIWKVLRGHIEDVYDLAWSPNSQFLVSGSVDNTAIMWDVHKGKSLAILDDHKSYVQGVAWDPKNQYIATMSTDRHLRIFDIHTKKVLQRIRKSTLSLPENNDLNGKTIRLYHDGTLQTYFRRLSFTPDGKLLLTPAGITDYNGVMKPINMTYGFSRYSMQEPALLLPCPDQFTVAVRCSPVLYQLRKHNAELSRPVIDLPYRMIFAVATKCSVFFYDTQQLQPFAVISNIHYTRLTDLTWSTNGLIVIVSSTDGFCSLITFKEGELGTEYEDSDAVLGAVICNQSNLKINKKTKKSKPRKLSADELTARKLLQDKLNDFKEDISTVIQSKPSQVTDDSNDSKGNDGLGMSPVTQTKVTPMNVKRKLSQTQDDLNDSKKSDDLITTFEAQQMLTPIATECKSNLAYSDSSESKEIEETVFSSSQKVPTPITVEHKKRQAHGDSNKSNEIENTPSSSEHQIAISIDVTNNPSQSQDESKESDGLETSSAIKETATSIAIVGKSNESQNGSDALNRNGSLSKITTSIFVKCNSGQIQEDAGNAVASVETSSPHKITTTSASKPTLTQPQDKTVVLQKRCKAEQEEINVMEELIGIKLNTNLPVADEDKFAYSMENSTAPHQSMNIIIQENKQNEKLVETTTFVGKDMACNSLGVPTKDKNNLSDKSPIKMLGPVTTPIVIKQNNDLVETDKAAVKCQKTDNNLAIAADIICDKKVLGMDERFESPEKKNTSATPIKARRQPRTPNNTNETPIAKSNKHATPIAVRRTPRALIPSAVNVPAVVEEAVDAWPLEGGIEPLMADATPTTTITVINKPQTPQKFIKKESETVAASEVTAGCTEDIHLVYEDTVEKTPKKVGIDEKSTTAESAEKLAREMAQTTNTDVTPSPNTNKTPRRVAFKTISTPKSKKKLLD